MKNIRFLLLIAVVLLPSLALSQPLSLKERIKQRDFPSIFQAWTDSAGAYRTKEKALHDLYWHDPRAFELNWNNRYVGLADGFTAESIRLGKTFRDSLLQLNPQLVLLTEICYRDREPGYLPADSKWWMRDSKGAYVFGWEEGGFIRLELRDTSFQNNLAKKASEAIKTGVFDGIFLDWWNENEYLDERLLILKKIRQAIGPDALIIVNANELEIPNSAPYVNGLFMECWDSPDATVAKWEKYRTTLEWAEANLREPRVNCLETWWKNSRDDLNRMRATTTMSLTRSNGYSLFSDPNTLPTPDHLHDWYDFYNVNLGVPLSNGTKRTDNAYQRNFSNGSVLYNPIGNTEVTVEFAQPYKSTASGNVNTKFTVQAFDGDIFIKQPPNK